MEFEACKASSLVSIITPVRNCIKYLEICIQSVLNQTYPCIEHIFVDGGSIDGTLEVLTSYQTKYPERIKFISESDRSAGEAWNKGWRMARGDIFGWLGADDTYESDAIMTVVEYFRGNPDDCFVYGGCNTIDEKGKLLCASLPIEFSLDELINKTNYISCPSAFYKREVIEKIGSLDTRETGVELDYWIRVGKVFSMHRIEKVLSNFRDHKESVSGGEGAYRMYVRDDFTISRRHGGSIYSRRARRYYRLLIADALRPVFGFAYPFADKVLSYIERLLKRILKRILNRKLKGILNKILK
ncbi:glycosyltransferase family 2 protein [Chloroflexota bacterium]